MDKVLIIGQGLAGTCIARKLEQKGISVKLIASSKRESASKVAAGVWNPVVVRRFIPAWRAEESLISCREFYEQEEALFNEVFFITQALHKIYSNKEEIGQFQQAWTQGKIDIFCDEKIVFDLPKGVKLKEGALRIKESGYMDVARFITKERERWESMNSYQDEEFDYSALKSVSDRWEYQNQKYDAVVFCDGIGALSNPFMPKIPLIKVKGETITVKLPNLDSDIVLNKALFILPLGSQEYKVGATYLRDAENSEISDEAKQELLDDLSKFINTEGAEVLDQQAGFRPAVLDRRPLIGALPTYKGLYMLNGLGSRGVMLAPLMAEELSELMLRGIEPNPEARLQRFAKKMNL